MAGFCGECGNVLADGAKFCTNCGAAVSTPGVTANRDTALISSGVTEPPPAFMPAASEPAPVSASAPEPAPETTPRSQPDPSSAPMASVPMAPEPMAHAPMAPFPTAAPMAPEPMAVVRNQNNKALMFGGGAALIALAALAGYFVMSKPATAKLEPETAAVPTKTDQSGSVPAGMEPIAGVTPVAGATAVDGTLPAAAATGAPANTTAGAAVGQSVIKYANGTANIRDIATAEAPSRVVGSVKRGASVNGVMHVGISGSTYWFKLADGRGYISAVNLVDAPPVGPAPAVVAAAPAPAAASGPTCTVVDQTGSNLRIRNAPNGGVIGGLPNGIKLRFLSEATDTNGALWYRVDPVKIGYPTGWVFAEFVAC